MKAANIAKLEALGFVFDLNKTGSDYATRAPERVVNTGKDTFKPAYRDIYLGLMPMSGFYLTSSIKGRYRGFRCRNWNDASFHNVFAHGKTEDEVVDKWIEYYKAGKFNVTA